jgi:RimJ/RimL family protein N-acetyltransferase
MSCSSFAVATKILPSWGLPGFEQLVGRWNDAQHRSALADGRHAYFIARFESEAIGFAIVRDWASAERVAHIKRVVVSHPGRGHGKALLVQLVQIIFQNTDAHRIWLGVVPGKIPALVAARGSAFFGGRHWDEVVMSLLRPDWAAGRQLSARETT